MFNGNGDTLNTTPEPSVLLSSSSSLYTCGWYYSKMMEQQQSNLMNSSISAGEHHHAHVSKKLRINQNSAANSTDLHGTYENDEMSKILK